MIKTKMELNNTLEYEKRIYFPPENKRENFIEYIVKSPKVYIYMYLIALRKTEYYYNQKKSVLRDIGYLYYRRKKNRLGLKLGIEMWENTFDVGLNIFHNGSIVVNGRSRIGKNCRLHGDNCIGNNGKDSYAPIIGDNVDIGVGAKIIGNVKIANNIKIGAGAIVTKSFDEEGITIIGCPAHKI